MRAGFHSEAEPLRVRGNLSIPRAELVVRATRASGPGGQHVNKTSTRIELLWNVRNSTVLEPEERDRIEHKLAGRIDSEGWLRIVASESRSQLRNRRMAEEKLATTVRQALHVPRRRRLTNPTAASRAERLRTKAIHSRKKRERQRADFD